DSKLIAIDLGRGKNRLGLSVFAQVTEQVGTTVPTVESAKDLRAFFETIQSLNAEGKILAYHDRSDGGFFATWAEMCFAGKWGATLDLSGMPAENDSSSAAERLFSEELGALVQVHKEDVEAVLAALDRAGLGTCSGVV